MISGRSPAQCLGDAPPRLVVVKDRQVAELETDVLGSHDRGRAARFLRRMAEIASASCSALPQSPGVIVAIVTSQPASRNRINVPAH